MCDESRNLPGLESIKIGIYYRQNFSQSDFAIYNILNAMILLVLNYAFSICLSPENSLT